MKRLIYVVFAVAPLILMGSAFASNLYKMKNFSQIDAQIEKFINRYGPENVLLCFDIDETLLTGDQYIGSDVWFAWQKNMLNQGTGTNYPKYLIAPDFDTILMDGNVLAQLTTAHVTENSIKECLQKYQDQGVKALILTARALNSRYITEQELKKTGLFDIFQKMSFAPGSDGEYAPYDLNDPEKYGLSEEEIAKFNLGVPDDVSYNNGIMIVKGQNKGVMLQTLLKKTSKQYKCIVFVDDNYQNDLNMYNAFYYFVKDVDMEAFQYTHDAEWKDEFLNPDNPLSAVNQRICYDKWKELEHVLNPTLFF